MSTTSHEREHKFEQSVKRNPHPDFKGVEASRPDWRERITEDGGKQPLYTKTRDPNWKLGQGGNDNGEYLAKKHVSIDPYEDGRPAVFNYKLMISAIVPRPIGFLSTVGKDGVPNLAPFSFFQMVNFDPPIFVVGFLASPKEPKDTLANIIETKECTVNVISEHFVEAANACSINSPYGVSEWSLVGLHPAPTKVVKPARVKEAVFSAECTLVEVKEWQSKAKPGTVSGAMAILEGVNFWVREDAINEERNGIDPNVLRPVSRLGGISYGRVTDAFELLRPDFAKESQKPEVQELMKGN
ncbi:hypothetical protein DTO027B5_6390 [Paecilomyces variotii]|nr:hypothetical protein DTO169C6_5994 [Paecilomyces variotii]KAJ9231355.1 hypothetical protein DTO166G5_6834 [Paecilomyces variotii]KAJ9256249.1 hypothetical protein DTO195F2_5974 [Paecilomyces variotii]KAJ9329796.1 hypothetical protein DTO027B3_283 [Paecilomyces variotii]KAJ9331859.1 hypothetical protein DTO027B5_6390 [Paecilomyces variotii]